MVIQTRDRLELEQIQANIVPGFYKDVQDFIFVRFPDAAAGRDWLAHLPKVSFADRVEAVNRDYLRRRDVDTDAAKPGESWANVALSHRGLLALGVDTSGFAREFQYSPEERAEALGDKAIWRDFSIGGADTEADALLIIGANDDTAMRTQHDTFDVNLDARTVGPQRLPLVAYFRGQSRNDHKEHFGFFDTLSQPVPKVVGQASDWQRELGHVAPGEFILGLADEKTDAEYAQEVRDGLGAEPDWTRNGSYLVFRSMRQYVDQFEDEMRRRAGALTEQGIPTTPQDLMAKLIGRARTDDSKEPLNFGSDPDGEYCPLYSHIRKANPRDDHARSDRHRMIRRGIPYGSKNDVDRGLLFVAYQASIARQFEFVQTQWLGVNTFPRRDSNPSGPVLSPLKAPGADPITGYPTPGNRTILYHRPGMPMSDYHSYVHVDLPSFVGVTGCGYFFSPSRDGIAAIVALTGAQAS